MINQGSVVMGNHSSRLIFGSNIQQSPYRQLSDLSLSLSLSVSKKVHYFARQWERGGGGAKEDDQQKSGVLF
jgi:hypothetical protein